MERVARGKVLSAQQLMDLRYQCPFNTNCVDADYCHPVFRGNQMKCTWHTARNPLQEQDPTAQYNCLIIQLSCCVSYRCYIPVQTASSDLHNIRVGFKQEERNDCLLLLSSSHTCLSFTLVKIQRINLEILQATRHATAMWLWLIKYQCSVLKGGSLISGFKSMPVDFYTAMTQTETCGSLKGRKEGSILTIVKTMLCFC